MHPWSLPHSLITGQLSSAPVPGVGMSRGRGRGQGGPGLEWAECCPALSGVSEQGRVGEAGRGGGEGR